MSELFDQDCQPARIYPGQTGLHGDKDGNGDGIPFRQANNKPHRRRPGPLLRSTHVVISCKGVCVASVRRPTVSLDRCRAQRHKQAPKLWLFPFLRFFYCSESFQFK